MAILFPHPPAAPEPLRRRIREAHDADEAAAVDVLVAEARLDAGQAGRVADEARRLVEGVRRGEPRGLDAFLREYRLSTPEGVVLMCLAEALLRIPDAETRDRLIRDKIGGADCSSTPRPGRSC